MNLSEITKNQVPQIIRILADPILCLICLYIIVLTIIGIYIISSNQKQFRQKHRANLIFILTLCMWVILTTNMIAIRYTQVHPQYLIYQGEAKVVKVSPVKHEKIKQYPSQMVPTEKVKIRNVTVKQGNQTYTSKQSAKDVSQIKQGDTVQLQYKISSEQRDVSKYYIDLKDIPDEDFVAMKHKDK